MNGRTSLINFVQHPEHIKQGCLPLTLRSNTDHGPIPIPAAWVSPYLILTDLGQGASFLISSSCLVLPDYFIVPSFSPDPSCLCALVHHGIAPPPVPTEMTDTCENITFPRRTWSVKILMFH